MDAVSKKSALFLRLTLASATSVWALEAPGCSGTVTNSHGARADDGGIEGPATSNGGSGNVPSRRGAGGGIGGGGVVAGGPSASPLCGNGVIDPGESCDGTNLNNGTCYYSSMGALLSGTLGCTGCMFDFSGCYGGGFGGQAGGVGFAGSPIFAGAAGMAGMLGVDPVAVCYANGGVPDPSNPSNCTNGPEATKICEMHYVNSRLSTTEPVGLAYCASGCGCTSCAPQYDSCAMDYNCMTILDCVERTNCARMVDCYQPATCQSAIDSAGGQRSQAAIKMSNALACMSNAGCTMSCATVPPPGP